MRAASLRFITASKPPACLVKDRKLGTLKTDPAPLSPAPRAAACFMASGFCASLLPTWSTPLSAYAAPATPQPIANADVMGSARGQGRAWTRGRRCKAADLFHDCPYLVSLARLGHVRAFDCTQFAYSSLFAQHVGSERAVPVAFLPPYGPLLELDGELGLDVGEAVHDALELVEGEAAAAVEVALAHDVVHLVRVRVRVRVA